MVSSKPVSVSRMSVRIRFGVVFTLGAAMVPKKFSNGSVIRSLKIRLERGTNMDIIVISVSWGESRCPAPADPRSGADARCACPTSGCAALRNGRRACERAGRLFRRRLGCFRCGPVQGAVPLNSYCYSPRVSTLQARVLTRYLHVIFASRCGNLRGRRGRKSRGGHRATRPRTAQLPLRSRNELSTGPTSHPQATRASAQAQRPAPHLHAAFMLL